MNDRHRLAQMLQDALVAHPQAGPIPVQASLLDAAIAALRFPVDEAAVNRFLGWKLPEDFHPDAGISFKPEYNVEFNAKRGMPPERHQPVGTNLLTATQAKAMLEHVMEQPPHAA